MAANSTTENTTKNPSRRLTTYDLVIGILAIFSLIILIPLIFGNLSPSDAAVLNTLENGLCIIFLFDFFRRLRLAPKKCAYFLNVGGARQCLSSFLLRALAH